jgi:hypothetical protein
MALEKKFISVTQSAVVASDFQTSRNSEGWKICLYRMSCSGRFQFASKLIFEDSQQKQTKL